MAEAQFALEPTARNSKRLPVKAKGRGAVAVGIVDGQFGYLCQAEGSIRPSS